MTALLSVVTGFLVYAVGLYFSIQAIMGTRSPQGAIAWSLGLLVLPFIFVPAYLLVGRRRFDEYVEVRSQSRSELLASLGDYDTLYREKNAPGQDVHPVMSIAAKLMDTPVSINNTATLLINGAAKFDAVFAAIEKSRSYVLVQYYVLSADKTGERFCTALHEAVKRGVRVYVMYDELGCIYTPGAFFDSMKELGFEVAPFKSFLTRRRRFQLNFRNHRKTVVVDGQEAFVGGLNAADEYIDGGSRFEKWRDTHVSIRGPAVAGAQLAFLEDWYWSTGQDLNLKWRFEPDSTPGQQAVIVPIGPSESHENCTLLYLALINSAVERIWLTSPYLVPPTSLMFALKLAVLRGVDVKILIPEKIDHLFVNLAGASYRNELSESGVDVFCYTDGFMHQKVLLVDDVLAGVGSVNLDRRSFHLNFETLALVADKKFAHEVEQMLIKDLGQCDLYDPASFEEKSFWYKLSSRCAYLASPML